MRISASGRFGLAFILFAPLGCEPPDEVGTAPPPAPGGLAIETSVRLIPETPWKLFAQVTVRFHNDGEHSVWILKPLDGSIDGRLMPHYRITVLDPSGQILPRGYMMCFQCGTWWGTEWPRDYLVEVSPVAVLEVQATDAVRPAGAGRYTVQFEYTYQPGEHDLPPPARAWRGRLVAADVVADYQPGPPPRDADPPLDPEAPKEQ